MFVSSLSRDTTVGDLLKIFTQLEGYERIKIQTAVDGSLVCFVDFISIQYSSQAKSMIQGFKLNGSKMKISYAKTKMNYKSSSNDVFSSDMHIYDSHLSPNYSEEEEIHSDQAAKDVSDSQEGSNVWRGENGDDDE